MYNVKVILEKVRGFTHAPLMASLFRGWIFKKEFWVEIDVYIAKFQPDSSRA